MDMKWGKNQTFGKSDEVNSLKMSEQKNEQKEWLITFPLWPSVFASRLVED